MISTSKDFRHPEAPTCLASDPPVEVPVSELVLRKVQGRLLAAKPPNSLGCLGCMEVIYHVSRSLYMLIKSCVKNAGSFRRCARKHARNSFQRCGLKSWESCRVDFQSVAEHLKGLGKL